MLITTRSPFPAPSRAGATLLAVVVILATPWLGRPLAAQTAGGGVLTLDAPADAAGGHSGEMEIESWSWGTTAATTGRTLATPPPAGPGSITIVRAIDRSSPKLAEAIADGTIFARATLTMRPARPGDRPLTITLENVRIASIQRSSASGDDVPTETMTLNFGRIR